MFHVTDGSRLMLGVILSELVVHPLPKTSLQVSQRFLVFLDSALYNLVSK